MNRAIARRPLFENRYDVRLFLSHLAREVRRGGIEIHSWCVMTTHFHLLVRSIEGELGPTIGRATNKYVRAYNRSRRRDGPLVRGRFKSKPVDSEAYRAALIRYIDDNPVAAGIRATPWAYPWGSAAAYAHRSGPAWLERSWVMGQLDPSEVANAGFGRAYRSRFPARLRDAERRWVEATLASAAPGPNRMDDLVLETPARTLDWMQRKSALADGHAAGFPVADLASTLAEAARQPVEAPIAPRQGRPLDLSLVLGVGLGRDVAGATWHDLAASLGRSSSQCRRLYLQHHRRLLEGSSDYQRAATLAAWNAVKACRGHERRIGAWLGTAITKST